MQRMGLVLAALAMVPATARAHGRPPEVGQLAFDPTDNDFIVAGTTFSLLVSRDGGATWSWICRDVAGIDPSEDPRIAVTADGSILSAAFGGMTRGTQSGCAWSYPAAELEGTVTIDALRDPTEPAAAFVLTSPGDQPNMVYRSDDNGAAWAPQGTAIAPAGYLSEALQVAPSDPQRIYVSGAIPPTADLPRQAFVYRSDDGGVRWEELPFALREGLDRNIYVLAVDPMDPDRVFMRVRHEIDGGEPDRLVRSDNGGMDWVDVDSMDEIRGLAASADGTTMWLAGSEGIRRSDNSGVSFVQLPPEITATCVAVRGAEVWACANNFLDGFAIGVSTDGGESFEPVLRFEENLTGVLECAPGTSTGATCPPMEDELWEDVMLPREDAGVPDGGPGADGGPGLDAGPGSDAGSTMEPHGGGCSCRAAGPARIPGAGAALLLAVALLRRRHR